MAASSRTAQFQRIHQILKKHYQPVLPDQERPVLEQLLFACCLQNAHHEPAEEAYAAICCNFFDFNEVRVGTIRELAEEMPRLPNPAAAAARVKRVLQSVFEATYSFQLEELRKQNLGPTIEQLRKIDGTTPFAISHVVQNSLCGHAIPVDEATASVLRVVGLASEEEEATLVIPGLDRSITKSKGPEFASLLHQLGADFARDRRSDKPLAVLKEIDPNCESRLAVRRPKKSPDAKSTSPTSPTDREAAGAKKKSKSKVPADKVGKLKSPKPKKTTPAAKKATAATSGSPGKSTETPLEKSARKKAPESSVKSTKKASEKTPKKPTKKTPEKPTKKTPGKPTKKTPGKPTKKTPGKPTKKTPGKPTKKTPEKKSGKGTTSTPKGTGSPTKKTSSTGPRGKEKTPSAKRKPASYPSGAGKKSPASAISKRKPR